MVLRAALRVFVVAVAILAVAVGLRRYGSPIADTVQNAARGLRHQDSTSAKHRNTGDIRANVVSRLAALEADTSKITLRVLSGENTREMRAAVPKGHPTEWMVWFLGQATDQTSYRLTDCTYSPLDRTSTLLFCSAEGAASALRLIISEANRFNSRTGRMAIMVEGFGFKADQTTMDILSFPQPLTVSIAPVQGIADWTSQIANHYHKEVAIYLPLEPAVMVAQPPKSRMVMVHYSESEIRGIIDQAARLVPSYSGFCSYSGSRVLEDSRVTKIVLTEIKNRNGYFVDIRTTANALAKAEAAAAGVAYRQVDDRMSANDPESTVDSVFTVSIRRAQRTGSTLLCASPSAALTAVLKRRLASLAPGGITLVHVSELLGHDSRRE